MNGFKVRVKFPIKSIETAYPDFLIILMNPEYTFFKYMLFVSIFYCPGL